MLNVQQIRVKWFHTFHVFSNWRISVQNSLVPKTTLGRVRLECKFFECSNYCKLDIMIVFGIELNEFRLD